MMISRIISYCRYMLSRYKHILRTDQNRTPNTILYHKPPWPCHDSGGQSLASHRGDPGSSPGQVMWDYRLLRFPLPILIPLNAPHSSIRGWYNRPNSGRRTKWTQSHPTSRELKRKTHQKPIGRRNVQRFNCNPGVGTDQSY
jgi:hypothetical protein